MIESTSEPISSTSHAGTKITLTRTKNSPAQGQEFKLYNPEPWESPVDGEALLDELTATFKRYAILPDHADTALALWVTFTWCIDSLNVSPILAICSPEKQCGKTTVLTLISKFSAKSLTTSNL